MLHHKGHPSATLRAFGKGREERRWNTLLFPAFLCVLRVLCGDSRCCFCYADVNNESAIARRRLCFADRIIVAATPLPASMSRIPPITPS